MSKIAINDREFSALSLVVESERIWIRCHVVTAITILSTVADSNQVTIMEGTNHYTFFPNTISLYTVGETSDIYITKRKEGYGGTAIETDDERYHTDSMFTIQIKDKDTNEMILEINTPMFSITIRKEIESDGSAKPVRDLRLYVTVDQAKDITTQLENHFLNKPKITVLYSGSPVWEFHNYQTLKNISVSLGNNINETVITLGG